MMTLKLPISLPQDKIQTFAVRHHIKKLSLFGSVLRNDFTPQSDVDVLVEFIEGKTPGWEIVTMQDELSTIIGRVIDLRTPAELSRYFREKVNTEAVVIYDQN